VFGASFGAAARDACLSCVVPPGGEETLAAFGEARLRRAAPPCFVCTSTRTASRSPRRLRGDAARLVHYDELTFRHSGDRWRATLAYSGANGADTRPRRAARGRTSFSLGDARRVGAGGRSRAI